MKGGAGIIGCGYHVPEGRLTNKELSVRFGLPESCIESKAGIKERRIAPPGSASSDLGAAAARKALKNAGVRSEDIGLVLVATTTPDMVFPSTACFVQKAIGAKNAAALDISAACAGFAYGLDIAACYVSCGRHENVLLVGAETYSRITNPDDLNTSVLFGDGAGAAVIGKVPEGFGVLDSFVGADGHLGGTLCVPAGGSWLPLTPELLERRQNTIMMDGREVFTFAVNILENMIGCMLKRNSLSLDDISLIVPHQANKRILQNVCRNMNIPDEKMYCNLENYGNMSAASIPVALAQSAEEGRIKKGCLVLLAAFGAGFTWGASLLRWS